MARIHVVGGGLAGCEAAWQALQAGHEVILHEMRPLKSTAAHHTGDLAELVCSNSLKSNLPDSAPGLLKAEMQALDSLIIRAALASAVPAGNALAVERKVFSKFIADSLGAHENFRMQTEEIEELPSAADADAEDSVWIIASGPLTSPHLSASLQNLVSGKQSLHFYDAIAPILEADSIDSSIAFRASRYEEGDGDYINLPLNKEEYEAFIDAVMAAEKSPLHEFEETKYFEACLPIEVMIERGRETLRFGPMKPMGLVDPRTGHRPWAAVQLRQENREGSMLSMVGFQTKMKWPEQKRVFAMLPGLRDVEFFRFGSVHRNTYLRSPELLSSDLSFRSAPHIFLAGQITGVEGYVESAAIGLVAGRFASARLQGKTWESPPSGTMLGALTQYVTKGGLGEFQPMNANLGLLPSAPKLRRQSRADRKAQQADQARQLFSAYLNQGDGKGTRHFQAETMDSLGLG